MSDGSSLFSRIYPTLLTLAISAAGGAVATALSMPAGWLMGGCAGGDGGGHGGVADGHSQSAARCGVRAGGDDDGRERAPDSLSLIASWAGEPGGAGAGTGADHFADRLDAVESVQARYGDGLYELVSGASFIRHGHCLGGGGRAAADCHYPGDPHSDADHCGADRSECSCRSTILRRRWRANF
jgi:hypothetical protein